MCSVYEVHVVLCGEVCLMWHMQCMCDMAYRFVPYMCAVYVRYGVYV